MRARHDYAVTSTRALLERLRTRGGLTVERLRATELPLGALLELDVVRQLQRVRGLAAEEAVVETIRDAASRLEPTHRLVVDVILGLGLLRDVVPRDSRYDQILYADELAGRRAGLVELWDDLHALVGARSAGPAPTVRALRSSIEADSLAALAASVLCTSPLDVPGPRHADAGAHNDDRARRQRPVAVVIGAGVTDHICVVEHVPQAGASIQARSFDSQPGGKGLNQAVAAARLGMDTYLVAAVGDDDAGSTLLAYLESEGVNTGLVKVVPGARTPTTVVIVLSNGSASTIGYKGEARVQLDASDIKSGPVGAAIRTADFVMVTFEPPTYAVESVLQFIDGLDHRPTVLMAPSPPYQGSKLALEQLKRVDFVIGNRWELHSLVPESADYSDTETTGSLETLISQILMLGAGAVCIAEQFGCMIRSTELSIDVPHFPAALRETTGARDAFLAALASRFWQKGGNLEPVDAYWATAAMAASQSFSGVASSMPTQEEIDRVLKLSAFSQQERPS